MTITTKTPWTERFDTFIKSKEFNIGTVIFFSIVVSVLIAYGIFSHKEPGFMTTTPSWVRADFPLQVCPVAYVGDSTDALDLTSAAISTINGRLDFTALQIADARPEQRSCDIDIVVGVPVEAGWTDPGGNARIRTGHVKIETANVHGELRDLVLQHELGHALSLAHDSYRRSIMFGGPDVSLSPTPYGELPPWISDSDRDLIRTNFGPVSN